jgi:hypothetical protein
VGYHPPPLQYGLRPGGMRVSGRVACLTASGQVRPWASICALFVPASSYVMAAYRCADRRLWVLLTFLWAA